MNDYDLLYLTETLASIHIFLCCYKTLFSKLPRPKYMYVNSEKEIFLKQNNNTQVVENFIYLRADSIKL